MMPSGCHLSAIDDRVYQQEPQISSAVRGPPHLVSFIGLICWGSSRINWL